MKKPWRCEFHRWTKSGRCAIPGCKATLPKDVEPGPRDTVHGERMRARNGQMPPTAEIDASPMENQ